ncbi:transcription factor Adf-1 [Dermacentor silvarum]|uniref:transcription factor Adf-1 n=1 Tax=Dermacentor silvarum TaxID=543639 RepID=UPI001898FB26|nr:transcription factor Adf-1 [Dermacentor silvarum]
MAGMIIDAVLLIAAVEQRPALWMASHRQHKDKYVKAALWREVAAAVMPGVGIEEAVELAQKRWKSLRDKFRRIFFAHKNRQRRGAGQDDVESGDSTWPFFDLLLFLKDTMQTRVTSGNYTNSEASPASQPVSPASQMSRPASQTIRPASQPVGPPSPAASSQQTAQELLGNIMQFEDIDSEVLLESSRDATFQTPSRAPSPY